MWIAILAALIVIALIVFLFRTARRKDPPHDTYVCDICGEKDCICRKEQE